MPGISLLIPFVPLSLINHRVYMDVKHHERKKKRKRKKEKRKEKEKEKEKKKKKKGIPARATLPVYMAPEL